MTVVTAHIRAGVLELVRYPSFSLSALLFPSTLLLVFRRAYQEPADVRLAGFSAVAVLGVVFFQFGVGIASERVGAWDLYLRTLPAAPRDRIVARVCSALLFAAAAVVAVVVTACATTTVGLAPARWLALVGALLSGAIPFGLLGIAIGYLARPRAALPIANLLYLPLSYLGGLWLGPGRRAGSSWLLDVVPTHAWARVLWPAVGAGGVDVAAPAFLAAWGVLFAALAVWGYRRDEGERFA